MWYIFTILIDTMCFHENDINKVMALNQETQKHKFDSN